MKFGKYQNYGIIIVRIGKGNTMLYAKEPLKKVIEYQVQKSKELKRDITLSEALALWLWENVNRRGRRAAGNIPVRLGPASTKGVRHEDR